MMSPYLSLLTQIQMVKGPKDNRYVATALFFELLPMLTAPKKKASQSEKQDLGPQVGKAGDPLPPFQAHMIRQKVTRNGNILPLEPESELPQCRMDPNEIGVIKEGVIRKWLDARRDWDKKFARARTR